MSEPLGKIDARARLLSAASWSCFGAGYLAAYFASTAVPPRLPWYYPTERRFSFESHPTGVAADFYGRVLLCLIVGALCFGIARLVLGRFDEARLARALRTTTVWCATLLVFTAALYVYLLAFRIPFPAPLPPGYVPR